MTIFHTHECCTPQLDVITALTVDITYRFGSTKMPLSVSTAYCTAESLTAGYFSLGHVAVREGGASQSTRPVDLSLHAQSFHRIKKLFHIRGAPRVSPRDG